MFVACGQRVVLRAGAGFPERGSYSKADGASQQEAQPHTQSPPVTPSFCCKGNSSEC